MNENNLPIFQEITKEKKRISEKEMANTYTILTEENTHARFLTELENLKYGFDKNYFFEHINAYIKECKKDKEPVYSSSRAPEKIMGLAGFSNYFLRLGPNEDEDNRKDFIKNLNKIFVANKFTSEEKTIPPKENSMPQKKIYQPRRESTKPIIKEFPSRMELTSTPETEKNG